MIDAQTRPKSPPHTSPLNLSARPEHEPNARKQKLRTPYTIQTPALDHTPDWPLLHVYVRIGFT